MRTPWLRICCGCAEFWTPTHGTPVAGGSAPTRREDSGVRRPAVLSVACTPALAAASQSALAPASAAAGLIHALEVAMAVGAVLVLAGVLALALAGVFGHPRKVSAARWIVGGGVAFPIVVLSVLLVAALLAGEALLRPDAPAVARVQVVAKQWWWEVRYLPPEQRAGSALAALLDALCGSTAPGFRATPASDAGQAAAPSAIVLANELRLPVGAPVLVELTTADVIHSFWVPSLAGKVDMIPGRVNRLVAPAPTAPARFAASARSSAATSMR